MKKSVVIIGGGLGGLFTGAILAKEGMLVTVVEKNPTIGGGLQSFTRFGEVFDTGMHVIGGMQEGWNINRMCKYLGILDKVQIRDVDADCTDSIYFAEDNTTYRIAKGREGFVNSLAEYFPEQKENLKRYVDAMYRLTEEMNLFYLRKGITQIHSDEFFCSATEFISKYITDSRLQAVVAYVNQLYSGTADFTPAYIHAVISSLYIAGPSRFAGGSHLFAELLAEVITSNGGTIIKGDAVRTVNAEERIVTSIATASGKELKADYYISAIDPSVLLNLFSSKQFPKSYIERVESIPSTYSAFTLNIKFKTDSFKYFNHTALYISRYADAWECARYDSEWPKGFLMMTPPEIEQGEYSRKMIVTVPMEWNAVEQWENTTVGKRGESYEAFKRQCADRVLKQMEKVFPGIGCCIENINTASPLTIRDYYGTKHGAMSGFAKDYHNLALSQLPVTTKISNLFLTGQNNNLHGFCGVPLTAITTCEAILGSGYLTDKL